MRGQLDSAGTSAGTGSIIECFTRSSSSLPLWCTVCRQSATLSAKRGDVDALSRTMSQPPTNSPSTYNWGIVGHCLKKETCKWVAQQERDTTGHARIFLDAFAQLCILEHIVRRELAGRNTMQLEDLDDRTRETTLRRGRLALHEEYERVRLDSDIQLLADIVCDQTAKHRLAREAQC